VWIDELESDYGAGDGRQLVLEAPGVAVVSQHDRR
jgi:hypothetical protein